MSKRTGTSKRKPAVMVAPAGGTCPSAKVTRPLAGSQENAVPSAITTPPTATRTLPATGFAMVRT